MVPAGITAALVGVIIGGMLSSTASAASTATALTLPPTTTFTYSGAEQVYTVPAGVVVLYIVTYGAYSLDTNSQYDGHGAEIAAYLPVTPGEKLYTEVGQPGSVGGAATVGGGGAPGVQSLDFPDAVAAASGGGATVVQSCSDTATSCPAGSVKKSRLIVAGGGGGTGGAGSSLYGYCDSNTGGGGANASGSGVVTTSAGSFIFGGGGLDTSPSTPAGGGTDTGPGAGGLQGDCTSEGDTFPDSVQGSSGHSANGGTGATGTADEGAGGGGGGGYFGGGGGASGSTCVSTAQVACTDGDGSGGGSGSSFVSSVAVFSDYGGAVIGPEVTYTPVAKIAHPKNGATYTRGQVVDASFICDQDLFGDCTGTVASGQPFNTSSVGAQTFSVQSEVVTAVDSDVIETGTVTYTVVR